jgi:hypothetical protein
MVKWYIDLACKSSYSEHVKSGRISYLGRSVVFSLFTSWINDWRQLYRDVSHPDTVHQNSQVLQTFARMKVPFKDKNNLLTVANKIDKISVRILFAFLW